MTLQRQIAFWILSFIGVVLALYVLRGILLPFLAGLALAYFLDPLADRLQRLGLSRFLASLLILVVFLLIFVGALLLVAGADRGARDARGLSAAATRNMRSRQDQKSSCGACGSSRSPRPAMAR
jgi:hypothetical protein